MPRAVNVRNHTVLAALKLYACCLAPSRPPVRDGGSPVRPRDACCFLRPLPPRRQPRGRGVYRPRHPERTPSYQLFERCFDRYPAEYEERCEPRYEYLRPVVARTVSAFMECGRLQSGFARIRCPKCRGEHLLAFSCQTRNFCPSCQAKRAALVAENLFADVLAPVPHQHLAGLEVVDAVLRSVSRGACRDPFAKRAPPAPAVGGAAPIQ